MKHDVVILLDSITRLARAYNTVIPASGKVLTGGVDAPEQAGTRREDADQARDPSEDLVLRKFIHDMDEVEAMEFLLDKIRQTKSNSEFFDLMRRGRSPPHRNAARATCPAAVLPT